MLKSNQLQSHLKALRLGGMLDTLQLRLDQAQQIKLGYLEFLAMLLEDEIARRAQRGLANRIAKAHFEEQKTLEDFDFDFNPKIPAQKIRDLATGRFIEVEDSSSQGVGDRLRTGGHWQEPSHPSPGPLCLPAGILRALHSHGSNVIRSGWGQSRRHLGDALAPLLAP